MDPMLLAEATGALDATTLSKIQEGADTMVATVGQVVPIVVIASVSVIALTAGINYALKKIRGVLSKAA